MTIFSANIFLVACRACYIGLVTLTGLFFFSKRGSYQWLSHSIVWGRHVCCTTEHSIMGQTIRQLLEFHQLRKVQYLLYLAEDLRRTNVWRREGLFSKFPVACCVQNIGSVDLKIATNQKIPSLPIGQQGIWSQPAPCFNSGAGSPGNKMDATFLLSICSNHLQVMLEAES